MKFQLRAAAIGFGLLAGLACEHLSQPKATGDASGGPASSTAAATVDGETITVGELDAYIKEKLFDDATSNRSPVSLYEVRSRWLDDMINERIVEKAASAENLSIDDYLQQQADAGGAVSEEEIAAFYNDNVDQMGGMSLDQMRDRIAAYLTQQRAVTIVKNMRADSDAKVVLEPYRVAVDAIGPSRGPEDAIVTIVEFSDFQCPFCQRVAPTIDKVVAKYPTQVRFVYRNLPLNNIHSRAQAAAEAAACADKQGNFWDYHDLLFANNKALSDEDLERHASDLGLDMNAFRQCVKNRETQALVDADLAAAESLQISGTPSFLINGIPLHGAQSFEAISAVVDSEIARQSSDGSSTTR